VARTIRALAGQRPPRGGFEIIVVDDGSSDETATILGGAAACVDVPLIVVPGRGRGPASARNDGIARARGAVVLLLGDDTVPAGDDLLAAHSQLHGASPQSEYAVLGRIVWAPDLAVSPLMCWLDEGGVQFGYGELSQGPVSIASHLYSSHVSLKRELLLRSGGFDERFPDAAVEDIELGVRLEQLGTQLQYRPELVVLHDHPTTLEASLERVTRVGQAAALYNQIHPERPHPGLKSGDRRRRTALRKAAPVLRLLAAAPLPARMRKCVWRLLHLAAYAEGYAAGPPPPRSGQPRAQVTHEQAAQQP
jgi:GT2 family glycosyltransferase